MGVMMGMVKLVAVLVNMIPGVVSKTALFFVLVNMQIIVVALVCIFMMFVVMPSR